MGSGVTRWRDSDSWPRCLLVAWTAHLSLRPTGGFLEPLIAKFGGSVIHRIRFVIYIAGVGFPLAMVALSALGYGFTANELIKRAHHHVGQPVDRGDVVGGRENSVRPCLADADGIAAAATPI